MAARERVEFDVIGRDLGGSKAFKDVGDAADKAGDKIKDSGEKAKDSGEKYRGLAHEISEVEGNVRRLAAEIDKTGNKELFKDLRKQQSELRKLTRAKDLLPDDDDTRNEGRRFGAKLAKSTAEGLAGAGETIANVFGKSLSGLPPQAQAAIGAGIVTAVAAAGTLVAGAVSGAVVGGLGAGGIVGGVAIAAKHPQVQAAAKLTGEEFSQELQRAAVSFVPATVESLSIVRSRIGDIGDDLERAFSASSTMLPGLTEHVLAGAERAVEGFANAVERSGPAVDAIGNIIERIGSVVGDTFEGMAEHADAGAHALTMLWAVFEFGIRSIAGTIEGLTAAYGWFEKIGAVVTGDTATLGRLAAEQELTKQSSGGLSKGLQDLIAGFQGAGDKAASAAVQIESLDQMVRRLTSENISAEQANIRLEEAIDRAAEAAKNGADKGINPNTEAGRKNRTALLGVAEAAQASAAAILKQTGSQELAGEASARGRAQFLKVAEAMGVEKGEALRLANQLFAIPDSVTTKVTALTDAATGKITGFKKELRGLDGKVVTVYTRLVTTGSVQGEHIPGAGTQLKAEGGRIFGPGTDTSDSIVTRVSRDEYVIRAAAARAIGYDTLDQLNQADRRPVAAGSAGASPPAAVGGGELLAELRGLRRDLATTPLVRLDSGRTADIYSRGG